MPRDPTFKTGQAARIDVRNGIIPGHVVGIDPAVRPTRIDRQRRSS